MRTLVEYIQIKRQPTAYVMVGLPGSGKSTWIENNLPDVEVVSRDIIRVEIGKAKSVDDKKVLSKEDENRVTDLERKRMRELAEAGKDFIVDDTNIRIRFRKPLIEFLRSLGCKIVIVNMNTPVDYCITRRDGQISADVLKKLDKEKDPVKDGEADKVINVDVDTPNDMATPPRGDSPMTDSPGKAPEIL